MTSSQPQLFVVEEYLAENLSQNLFYYPKEIIFFTVLKNAWTSIDFFAYVPIFF